VWVSKKKYDNAISDCNEAIRLDPNYSSAYNNRGMAWYFLKEFDKAIEDFSNSARIAPNNWTPYNNLAWVLATCLEERYRNGDKAVELAKKACNLSGWTQCRSVNTLAAAYAEFGDFESAFKFQMKALELGPRSAGFVLPANKRLRLYSNKQPYRE
jgi:Flp pilus assembly protein TadD